MTLLLPLVIGVSTYNASDILPKIHCRDPDLGGQLPDDFNGARFVCFSTINAFLL